MNVHLKELDGRGVGDYTITHNQPTRWQSLRHFLTGRRPSSFVTFNEPPKAGESIIIQRSGAA